MKLTATKTPLLIAAIATAVTLSSISQASADTPTIWTSATSIDLDDAQVIDANFKFKKHKFKGHKFHGGFKKKKYYSPKKKFVTKKKFKKFF